jgi:putative transcriptional regulator
MRSKSRVKNRIRELRFQHGEMTQEELARQIGVARQTIIAVEQGRYCPSLESALRMAKVFGTSVDQVFSLDEAYDNAG